MKFAYWGLLVLALALVAVGHFWNMTWLVFVAIAMILIAVALDPKRSFFGLRKSS